MSGEVIFVPLATEAEADLFALDLLLSFRGWGIVRRHDVRIKLEVGDVGSKSKVTAVSLKKGD